MQFVDWRRLETKVFIEFSCLLVNRVNENRASSHNVCRLSDSRERILQERFPEPSTLLVFVCGKPC